jgi:hypothetical protein
LKIFLRQVKDILNRYIDFMMGSYGAVVMAIIVFYINYSGTNELQSMVAASKQGLYTFFFGGYLMKGCEYIATHVKKQVWAIILSVVIPSTLTLLLTYSLHNLKGTPKPLESTLPTLFVIPSTAVWGYLKRKRSDEALIVEGQA